MAKEQIDEGNQLRIIKENQEKIKAAKPKKQPYLSEDAIQQLCYIWFHNTYPHLRGLLFHVPNGGSRNVIEAMKFKKIGVVAGVADLLFMNDGTIHCIELKTENGRQSAKQVAWQKLVEHHNFNYYVVRSLGEFKDLIQEILG